MKTPVFCTWVVRHSVLNAMLIVGVMFFAGCGANSDAPAPGAGSPAEQSTANGATETEATETSPSTTPAPVSGDKRPSAAAAKVNIPAPSAEEIKLWTPAPHEPLVWLGVKDRETSLTTCAAPAGDGKHFLIGGSSVLLWNIDEDEPAHVFFDLESNDEQRIVLALAVSPDGKWFVATDSTGTAHVWSLGDRSEIVTKKLHDTGIQDVAISPDGAEIATISYDNEVKTWSADKLDALNTFKVDTNGLKHIEYAAPGVIAAAGETTSLWDTKSGALAHALTPGRYSFALARSSDGKLFLYGGDESLHLWNVAESKDELTLKGSVSGSELVAFSPDGTFLATSDGHTIQVWNLQEKRVAQVIDGYGWTLASLAWLPESNLLVAASEDGCTRLWGTAADGEKLGLKPLPTGPTPPVDLRTFPRLPDAETSIAAAGDYNATVVVPPEQAKVFYHYFLTQTGWKPSAQPSANPAATEYEKNGSRLTVSCYDGGDGKTMVMVHDDGDFDVRTLPKLAGVTETYASPSTVMYRDQGDLLSIEASLLRQLSKAGWAPYSRLLSSHGEQPDSRDLNFLKDGRTLSVAVHKPAEGEAGYTIQYFSAPSETFVPLPGDAGFVEFNGSPEPSLVALSASTLAELAASYDRAMSAAGWQPRAHGRSIKDEQAWLPYLRGQCDVGVSLSKLPDGRTLVRVGDSTGSLWENSQAKEEPASDEAEAGLEAADFPTVNGAAPISYDPVAESLEVKLAATKLATAAERFTEALDALGWKAEEGGIRDEEYTMVTFQKGEKEITLRARSQSGDAVVNFQGDGLLWTKELPTGKQIVSYETWLRQNKLPPSLEFLDRYEAEMKATK